ncbi:MAG: flagellar protein [Clostridiales bacterium]|mgnify:FL=1|nr:flagellar protein [Clostridiales bacterium]
MYNYKVQNKLPSSINIKQNNNKTIPSTNFNQILEQHIKNNKELKFSKHATERLKERNIQLDQKEIARLDKAIDNAAKKGIKETLIIMDNRAFIASVSNKTIITATTEGDMKDNIFTNIDGVVII